MKQHIDENSPWIQCHKYFRDTQSITVFSLLQWIYGMYNDVPMKANINYKSKTYLLPFTKYGETMEYWLSCFYINNTYSLLVDALKTSNQKQAVEDVRYLLNEVCKIEVTPMYNASIIRFMGYVALHELSMRHLPV